MLHTLIQAHSIYISLQSLHAEDLDLFDSQEPDSKESDTKEPDPMSPPNSALTASPQQKSGFADKFPPQPVSGNLEKNVTAKFYIPKEVCSFFKKEHGIDLINQIKELEADLTEQVNQGSRTGVKLKYDLDFVPEIPNPELTSGSGCYRTKRDLAKTIARLGGDKKGENSVLVLDCPKEFYGDIFTKFRLDSQILTLNINTSCKKRAVIFMSEDPKSMIRSLAAGLAYVAGSKMDNPVDFEQTPEGGDISLKPIALRQLRMKNVCMDL